MAGRLENKVAIITGATSGIGRAVAVLFVKEGAKAVIAGHLEQNGLELERELQALGADVLFVRTDATKKEDLQYLVRVTIEKFGRIDILVNNYGVSVTDASMYLVLCREVLPYMTRQQKGSIINTAAGVEMTASGIAPNAAGKGAILAFTRSLAGEYADQGIRVNAIIPGLSLADPVPEGIDLNSLAANTVPLGRAARPEEIAYGFLFFAGDESSFCTGSNLVIDGGATAM